MQLRVKTDVLFWSGLTSGAQTQSLITKSKLHFYHIIKHSRRITLCINHNFLKVSDTLTTANSLINAVKLKDYMFKIVQLCINLMIIYVFLYRE